MSDHQYPPTSLAGMHPGSPRCVSEREALGIVSAAITAPHHLVEMSPRRRQIIEIGTILLGRADEEMRPIIVWEPVNDRLPLSHTSERALAMRQYREAAHEWELDALYHVLQWALPRVHLTREDTA